MLDLSLFRSLQGTVSRPALSTPVSQLWLRIPLWLSSSALEDLVSLALDVDGDTLHVYSISVGTGHPKNQRDGGRDIGGVEENRARGHPFGGHIGASLVKPSVC